MGPRDSPPQPRRPRTRVVVAELTAERSVEDVPEVPLHLLDTAGGPARAGGPIAVQLRTTWRRVVVGASLARRTDLLARVRSFPDLPGLAVSPVGGTFIIGGQPWLGLAAIGRPPEGALPIDWIQGALVAWFRERFSLLGLTLDCGRVEGGWCPGFSDLGAEGRKLIGLGYRATRDWVAMRGVMAVRPVPAGDLAILAAVHRFIHVDVRADSCTSLAELTGDPGWTVADAMTLLGGTDAPVDTRSPRDS